jgi:hypothetical protein
VPDYRQAAHNLLLLLYRSNDEQKARAFADRFGISAEEQARLQALARQPLAQHNTDQTIIHED